jgi:hypothetical protein
MPAIVVDPAGLHTAAARLSASTQTHTPPVAQPPGMDTTSVSAVAHLNAATAALAALLNHASSLREVGSLVVANTATMLAAQDDANAAGITSLTAPQTLSAPPPVPTIPEPVVPAIPPVPAALAPLPGEAHARALYAGAGSSSLHALADHLDTTATHLRDLSDDLTGTAKLVDTSWDDGHQQAGANVRHHGRWLAQISDHSATLAAHCRTLAHGFDTAKNNTPSPHEFSQARTTLNAAIARFNASGGLNATEVHTATQHLAYLNSQATSHALTYHTQTATTLTATTQPPTPAPPISRGATRAQAAGYHDLKQAPIPDPGTPDDPAGSGATGGADLRRVLDQLPDGDKPHIKEVRTPQDLQNLWDWAKHNGTEMPDAYRDASKGSMVELPDGTTIGQRPVAGSNGQPVLDVNVPGEGYTKVHINPRGGVPDIPAVGEPAAAPAAPRVPPAPIVEPLPPESPPPPEGGLRGIGGAPITPMGPQFVPAPHSIHHPFPILGEDAPGTPAEDFEP